MVDRIIVSYLSGNKRLVIPGFGAFLRKDPAGVVFVEFLKNDDGVLNSLLSAEMGVSEDEAVAIVGDFVTTINRRLHTNGSYIIEGLGELVMNSNGVCDLRYDPEQKNVPIAATEKVVAMSDAKSVGVSVKVVEDRSSQPTQRPVAQQATVRQSAVNQPTGAPEAKLQQSVRAQQPPIPKSVQPERPVGEMNVNVDSQNQSRPVAKPVVGVQSRVSKPSEAVSATVGQRVASVRNNNYNSEYVKPKKKTDVVMVMAIIVSIIAVISLLYGVFSDGSHVKNLLNGSDGATEVQVEQVDEVVEEAPATPKK